ncbi:MAG: AgmX/PglI C-terminal domain-containing protein [Deltaproteobacteria bacterium]|nr:AgmX/PglI C-terminal domain-containing protein [Deltaproteobacteria bacterium]
MSQRHHGITAACAVIVLAACGSSKPAEKPAEEPVAVEEPEEVGAIGGDEVLTEGGEPSAIADVLSGDLSEMSKKLAAAMGGEGSELVVGGSGTIVVGAPVVTGTCDPSRVDTTVRRRAEALRGCYEQRLRVEPALAGQVTLGLRIGAGGGVTHAQAPGLDDEEATACLVRHALRLRFDPGDAGCAVEIPLTFAPEP